MDRHLGLVITMTCMMPEGVLYSLLNMLKINTQPPNIQIKNVNNIKYRHTYTYICKLPPYIKAHNHTVYLTVTGYFLLNSEYSPKYIYTTKFKSLRASLIAQQGRGKCTRFMQLKINKPKKVSVR